MHKVETQMASISSERSERTPAPLVVACAGTDARPARRELERRFDRAEPALEPSLPSAAIRGLLDRMPDPVAIEREGCIVFANTSLARTSGHHDAASLVGEALGSLLLARSHPNLARLNAGKVRRELLHGRHVDGEPVLYDAIAPSELQYDGGAALLHTWRDVTDYEQASRVVSEFSFKTLAENAPWAILLVVDEQIAYANPSAVRLSGRVSHEELEGTPVTSIFHADEGGQVVAQLRGIGATLSKAQVQQVVRPGGDVRQVELRAFALSMPSPQARLVILEDVHERRQIQDHLERTERLAALGRMAAGVAHEINNPAAAIQGNVTFVLEELAGLNISGQVVDALNDSLEAVRRIARIVQQLKLSTRSATAGVALASTSVTDAVNTAVRLLAQPNANTTIIVEVGDNLRAMADEVFLGQALNNLLTNALQAARPGETPWIAVRARTTADRVFIDVEDHGTGMDEVTQKRIFEPFFTTKPVGQGTGLGLSVTQGLLRSMGGAISVESQLGQGTRFTIELIRARTDPLPAANRHVDGLVDPPLMLLIDDDPLAGRGIARQLRDQFHVMLVEDIDAALAFIANNKPDIILCDVVMPDGGAEKFLEMIHSQFPDLVSRVVITTGEATTPERLAFVEQSTNPMIAKPLSRTRLNAVWKQLKSEKDE